MSFDRGAFTTLTFKRCERGFTLSAYELSRDREAQWAFDRIEDLADWLVEQYENPPVDECAKPTA